MQLFMVLLCGDIGASNSRLAVLDMNERKMLGKEYFKNSDFSNFNGVLAQFQKKYPFQIAGACFGVAGPVIDGSALITNLSWVLNADAIARSFNIKQSFLINDLEAIGYGIPTLDPSQCQKILAGNPGPGHCAVIAPGSGMGESILFWNGKTHTPIASEGGHASFSPTSTLQLEFLHYLNKEFKHVSWERVLSGPGILNIYRFLKDTGKGSESATLAAKLKSSNSSAHITEAALNEKDPLSIKTVELYFEILATEAGNLALKCIPSAGLFIAGGITPKLLKLFDQKLFIKNFLHKGRMAGLLERIPVSLVLNDEVGIWGAGQYLKIQGQFQ